nr:hypothetical protein [uncultured Hyphomonas sp.]
MFIFISDGIIKREEGRGAILVKILWGALGTITGAMSVSSFLSQYSDLSLDGFILELVEYYQGLSSFTFGFIPSLVSIHVPQWLCDAWTLSFVLTAATFRMIRYDYSSRGILAYYHRPPILLYIVQSLTFIGVFNALFYCIPIVKRHPIKRTDPRTERKVEAPCYRLLGFYVLKADVYWYTSLLSIAGTVCLFFILSAYGP